MKFIPQSLTRSVGRQVLTMKKGAPGVFFVAGIVGTVASTVLACRATLKLEETLETFKDEVEGVKERAELAPDSQSRSDHNKDMAYVYIKGTFSIVKLYAPSILLGTASIGALTGSHVALTRRNAGLTAAYSAVQMSYDAYRDRVREQLGEEKELDIYHAAKYEKASIDGKMVEIRKVDPNRYSPYAKMFDEYNRNWQKNSELNKLFITCQQNYANHLLGSRGHVFLNEVYDSLGFEHTSAGATCGWVVGNGDNFIDFGIYDAYNADFVNGNERSIVLDFNVDGVIYNLI